MRPRVCLQQCKTGLFVARSSKSHRNGEYALQRYAAIEVQLLNQYEGPGMAGKIVEGGELYLRMPKISGKELRFLEQGEMSPDEAERFLDMLKK